MNNKVMKYLNVGIRFASSGIRKQQEVKETA